MSAYMRSWYSIKKLTSTSPPARTCAISKANPCISERPRGKEQQRAKQAQHQCGSEKVRHAKDAHLGRGGLEQGEQSASCSELYGIGDNADCVAPGWAFRSGETERDKRAADQGKIEQKLELRREFEHREMPAGILEHHRFVHHGEFEMRGRIVDRDAPVFGNRHEHHHHKHDTERDTLSHM